jgi:hypothetical protein
MKRGSGIKDRDDKSSGIDIRIADASAKINPTDPCLQRWVFFFGRNLLAEGQAR